jgi:CheY-like chemotaxis protein
MEQGIENKGRILVMEEEDMLRNLIEEFLERIGYKADLTREGGAAIKLYKEAMQAGRPYKAVILDRGVEIGMNGLETIKELLKIDPEVKAIISSGYRGSSEECREHGFRNYLNKPFTQGNLERVLKKIIGC